ncbi:glycoside hydrolase family 26 protein [Actinoplanes sp. N902-109]|uniref:glycoside hydrolase family 26 protein n=1 Tax=Actinoplanes sp. (strain N902-109) TaxID=649831 RepID=UPI0003294350|nr:glycosyl hydrolase [Actinoplanes sp. N902-109]AGL18386.1 Beta-mannanase [Actinoplanes sp. N902-109]
MRHGTHRAPRRTLTRRSMLGLGALAVTVPAAAAGVQQWRDRDTPAAATSSPGRTAVVIPGPATVAELPSVVTKGGGTVPFRTGKAMLGAYLDLKSKSTAQAHALRKQQTGRDERIVHVFYDWDDTLPASVPGLTDNGIPLVSWRGTSYDGIIDGSRDALLARGARRLKSLKRPVLLRWGWEMNGDWYNWGAARNGNNPDGFIESWKRVHGVFADEGADNVAWVWSPNWNSSPVADWNTYAALYPGDKYVDWVGVSGYNLHHETPATLFDPIYNAYGTHKPIMITEVGAVDYGGRTKADWITLFAQWVAARPAVGGVVWFDTDTHPGYDERWRIDTNPQSLAAYTAMARSPRFSG